MLYDYSKLKGRICEKYHTQENFAKALGIGRVSLSLRLNCKNEFSQNEILRSVTLLKLDNEDISEYFFKEKV